MTRELLTLIAAVMLCQSVSGCVVFLAAFASGAHPLASVWAVLAAALCDFWRGELSKLQRGNG